MDLWIRIFPCPRQKFYRYQYFFNQALFEDNQRDLEVAVEALSLMLEEKITPENVTDLRTKVLDKQEYVNRRRQVLLSDTAAGHLEHRWEYGL
jgi:ariadne-1